MKRKKVESSNIASVGYDWETMTLEVEFTNDDVYQYTPVTEQAYKDMMNAESVGGYFYKNIRNNSAIETVKQ